MDQRDFREDRVLRETARKLETNDRTFATEMVSPGSAQRAIAAWQLGPRRHAIAGSKTGNSRTGLHNTGTKFVAEQLDWSFGLQPAFDSFIGERWNPKRQLGLGDARLHTKDFRNDAARQTGGRRDLVEAHVTKSVKSPRFHVRLQSTSGNRRVLQYPTY